MSRSCEPSLVGIDNGWVGGGARERQENRATKSQNNLYEPSEREGQSWRKETVNEWESEKRHKRGNTTESPHNEVNATC